MMREPAAGEPRREHALTGRKVTRRGYLATSVVDGAFRSTVPGPALGLTNASLGTPLGQASAHATDLWEVAKDRV